MRVNNTFKSKVRTYLIKRLGCFDYKHGWMRVPICPYCGREQKMGVNLSQFRCNCFRCGEHPNPIQLIMDIENIETYNELLNFLSNEEFKEYTFREEKSELAEKKTMYLPEGFKNISFGKSQLARSIRSYATRRGFEIDALAKNGVGYCSSGPLFGYIIIPFYCNGQLIYYNARNVMGTGPRYRNPDKDISGLGKEFIIYNFDALYIYNTIYICEGVFNALTIGDRAIATMGKAISAYQVNQLIKASASRYIILLDPDAKDKAIELALKLVNFKKVKVVFLPDSYDVNDIGKRNTMNLIYNTRYQSYKDLITLKNEINYENQ